MSLLPVGFQLLQSYNLAWLIHDKEEEAQKQNRLWQLRDEYLAVLI